MKSIAYKTYINIGKHEFRVPDLNWNGTFNAGLSFEDILTSIEESISDYLIANYYSKDIDPPARDSIIEKKPPKAIETYILVNTEMIESDKDALEEMDEYEKTRIFNQMNSNENVLEWMKNSEASAKVVTDTLMADLSVTGLMMNIFCMGILTGIGEELFFRGALQNVLAGSFRNKHIAVWTAAVVFSAFHLQFYGFVPRMVMGAIFGYAMLWTGSVWVPAVAHALNNISVVVLTYLVNAGVADEDSVSIGVAGGFPWLALTSAVLTVVLMIVFNHLKCDRYGRNRVASV